MSAVGIGSSSVGVKLPKASCITYPCRRGCCFLMIDFGCSLTMRVTSCVWKSGHQSE